MRYEGSGLELPQTTNPQRLSRQRILPKPATLQSRKVVGCGLVSGELATCHNYDSPMW